MHESDMRSFKDCPAIQFPEFTIDFVLQKRLIDYTIEHCDWGSGAYVRHPDYLHHDHFGRFQSRRLTQQSLDKIGDDKHLPEHAIYVYHRFNPILDWEWKPTPITPLLEQLMESIKHVYHKISRVILLIQRPGAPTPLHIDRSESMYHFQDTEVCIQEHCNRWWGLKWPLTSSQGDNGKPIIMHHGKYYQYRTTNCLFAIKEGTNLHGAMPTAHYRGVIFADGILNWDVLIQHRIEPLDLQPVEIIDKKLALVS